MTPAELGSFLVEVSGVIATLGILLYGSLPKTRHTWFRDPIGRYVMAHMAVLALILDLAIVSVITGANRGDDWFAWLRTGVFILIPIVLTWCNWIIVRPYFQRSEKVVE